MADVKIQHNHKRSAFSMFILETIFHNIISLKSRKTLTTQNVSLKNNNNKCIKHGGADKINFV